MRCADLLIVESRSMPDQHAMTLTVIGDFVPCFGDATD
jgi:hypothetical protein